MQVAGLDPMDASNAEEGGKDQSDSVSSADEGIDDLGDDSGAASGTSEEEEAGAAGPDPRSTDRNPAAAKKQKTGRDMSGLGSVGWDASDEEEDQAVPLTTGMFASSSRYCTHCCFPGSLILYFSSLFSCLDAS